MSTVTSRADPSGDVLTSVLDALRVRGRVFCRSELSAPWGMRLPAGPRAHFHVVERGGAWLRVGSGRATALRAGDLALVPHGSGHVLSDHPDSTAVPLKKLLGESAGAGGHVLISKSASGPVTSFVCGGFTFERPAAHELLKLLPPVIHARSEGLGDRLHAVLGLLHSETKEARPGSTTVVSRLLDVIFVEALRAWIATLPPGAGGWLGALRDPQLGAALGSLHQRPEEPWTVDGLAREAGLSRSVFAERFTNLVGQPPLAYLSTWRMTRAASHLVDDGMALHEIASRVGYETEAAFSKAFKRRFGVSPGAFRSQGRAGGAAALFGGEAAQAS